MPSLIQFPFLVHLLCSKFAIISVIGFRQFKFVKLKDAELSGEQTKKLSEGELCQLPEIVN